MRIFASSASIVLPVDIEMRSGNDMNNNERKVFRRAFIALMPHPGKVQGLSVWCMKHVFIENRKKNYLFRLNVSIFFRENLHRILPRKDPRKFPSVGHFCAPLKNASIVANGNGFRYRAFE